MHDYFKILSVHITERQEDTWGRVYIQYEVDGTVYFIFKNWLKFKEHTFKGFGNLLDEPSFTWFELSKRHEYPNEHSILAGEADILELTNAKFKMEYGTPSKILKRLLIELKANLGEPIENRRGWFNRLPKELVYSPILVKANNQIWLTAYETEIELEPLHKVVYLLFLKHPEGIVFNQIDTYKAEIEDLYRRIRPDGVKDKIIKSLNNLTTTKKDNSLHEKISKIKKYLITELGEVLAEKYIIKGSKNEAYRINLPEDQIKFE
jgi:hypothetical protein